MSYQSVFSRRWSSTSSLLVSSDSFESVASGSCSADVHPDLLRTMIPQMTCSGPNRMRKPMKRSHHWQSPFQNWCYVTSRHEFSIYSKTGRCSLTLNGNSPLITGHSNVNFWDIEFQEFLYNFKDTLTLTSRTRFGAFAIFCFNTGIWGAF